MALNYNKKRACTRIESITEQLRKLIEDLQLEFDSDNNIVLLTRNNADKIENAIKNDMNYYPFAKRLYNSLGKEAVKNNTDRALCALIREIDRDNYTNVWRYGNRANLEAIVTYILDSNNNLWERLDKGDIELVSEMTEERHGGSAVKSLSSKVCKYLSEFIYEKDNYYINDSYVRSALLFYLDYYNVDHNNLLSTNAVNNLSYRDLFSYLEKLREAANKLITNDILITKNELDHILWYCYKSF